MNKAIPLPIMLIMGIAILICGTGVAGAEYVEIGTGTSSENYVPFNGNWDYGWSNTIYTQSEIGDEITITEIAFDISNSPSGYTVNDQRIYMNHTTDGTFADGTKPDPSTMTEVYNGSITWDGSGWCVITLDTPFSYNNADNLLIYYENWDGSYSSGYPRWYYTSQSNRVVYKYQDGSFPTDAGTLSSYVPNLRLYYTPCLQVEKKIYNGTDWVDEISDAQLGSTYRFRINVTSNCCNFTEIAVKDILSSSLTYEDSATPFEPNSTVGNVRYWNFSALDKAETVTIEFDVSANTYGYACNVANVTANCTDTGGVFHTAEDNACLNTAPLPNIFNAVWDNTDDVASTLGEDIFDICTANDLDEDGSQEIITGDQNGNVTVFENTGNDQYTDVWHVTPDGNDILAVCVCDLDGNGRKEIIAGGVGDTVYVYEWDGATGSNNYLPVSSLNIGDDINDLCCSDIDGDGDCELGIACADDHAYIYSVSGAWTWNMEFDSGDVGYDVYSVLCCCDLNNNGDKEFIFAEYDYDETYIYEGTAPDTYTLRWQQKVSSSDGRPYSMVCCDMDGDGYQELYIGDNNGELIVVTNTGDLTTCGYSLVHDFSTAINKIACGDEDADGMNDLYLAMDDNDITDLEFFGTAVTDYSHYFKSVIGVDLNAGNDARAVHCTDLDGDGNREVIAGYERLISYPGMKLLHVLEHSASCTLPGLDVDKTVYDPKTDTWVDSINGAIPGETYRFRINVTATCCNFTDVVINDTLSPSLGYAGNPSTPPSQQVGNFIQWTLSTINKDATVTIEFDATVSYRGDDCNLVNATGWCNESVPHEQYSDEDTACIDSRVDLAVKSDWNEHIKVNPACGSLDYHKIIVNESNTIRVWVINNGPSNITAGESFDVCFDLNGVGIACETVTGPLNAGEDVYFDIDVTPDCTPRPEWPNYPPVSGYPCECITPGYRLNVTVDASSVMNETDEGNNLGWRAVSICCNGYKSKNFDCGADDPLTLFESEEFYGGVVYNVSGKKTCPDTGYTYYFTPGSTDTRVHNINVPGTVVEARLYVYWYDFFGNPVPGCMANLGVNFSGTIFTTPDASYNDQKGLGTWNTPKGTYAYDVTSLVTTGSNDYTVVVENIDLANSTALLGEMLVVVYEDPSQNPDNYIQLWMMEGCDLLMESHGTYQYCVDVNESTATVAFPGTVADITSAELITVVAQGMEYDNNLLFNGDIIKTDAWDPSSEAGPKSAGFVENGSRINVEVTDVTDNMTSSDNTVGFQDTGTMGMQASNAILVVKKEAHEAAPNATVYFDPSDIRVPKYCDTETVGVWINSSDSLGSGTIIFDYASCCANVTDFAKDPVSFPGLSGEFFAATLTPGRVKIDFATGLLDGFPANIPVRLGNMTIHCCNPSDFCVTDLEWNCTGAILQNGDDVAITPVRYEDGTFMCNIPDLEVTEILPVAINDTHYTVDCTIENTGEANASASSANLTVDGSQVDTMSVPELAPGQAFTGSFTPVIELSSGSDDLMVCADYDDTVVELSETNNCEDTPYPAGVEMAIEFSPVHNITVAPGDEFIVNVTVAPRPGVAVYGVEYTLSFTPGVIFAEWQNEGDFLKQGGANTNVYIGEIDNVAGTLRFGVTRIDTPDGVTDKGVLARIGFTALEQQGVCTGLNFTLVKVSDPNAEPIELEPDDLIDGWICTTDNTRPVPDAKSTFTYNNVGEIYISRAYFDGSASYDPEGGSITKYSWAFGDGQYGTGETIDHIYDMWKWNTTAHCYDQFVVGLTVEDDGTPILDNTTEILVNVYIAGDANGDGEVDIFDATIVGLEWDEDCASGVWATDRKDQADLNNDCIVDIFDAVIVGANWDHTAWV